MTRSLKLTFVGCLMVALSACHTLTDFADPPPDEDTPQSDALDADDTNDQEADDADPLEVDETELPPVCPSITCDADRLCHDFACDGVLYYCTQSTGSWAWHTDDKCDDNSVCTDNDRCNAGTCSGTALECSDAGCCDGLCVEGFGCTKVPGVCEDSIDTCGLETLVVGLTCVGCTASAELSSCQTGGTFTCSNDDHTLCAVQSCNGQPYYCTERDGQWQWRSESICDDGDLCTYGDACFSGTCAGTRITCESSGCLESECNGSATCTEGPRCSASGCCEAGCSPSEQCLTTPGPCPDLCTETTLSTGRTCLGCGQNNAHGNCSEGDTLACAPEQACLTQRCGDVEYQCLLNGSTWLWREPCAVDELCKNTLGICAVQSCAQAPDLTHCQRIDEPDRAYDICAASECQSPGCGVGTCNAPRGAFPQSDTNQRTCYDDTTALTACPSTGNYRGQDAHFGWDVINNANTRYRRDLTVPNQPVVEDLLTGLFWQGCANGMTGATCQGSATHAAWSDHFPLCESLVWGGFRDWRMPNDFELESLVDYGHPSGPMIDPVAFPSTPAAFFHTSSTRPANPGQSWQVSFGSGFVEGGFKTNERPTRCVRGQIPVVAARFQTNTTMPSQPVVVDLVTGLHWQGCSAGLSGSDCANGNALRGTWQTALTTCSALSWGGQTGWRLPNVKELRSIVDNRSSTASFFSDFFPRTMVASNQQYWSSTTISGTPSRAWCVDFQIGSTRSLIKSNTETFVRCVRSP